MLIDINPEIFLYDFMVVISHRQFFSIFFSFRRNYLLSVRRPSVEIISSRGNLISNRLIDLKIGLNFRLGVVHISKALFFEILIAA